MKKYRSRIISVSCVHHEQINFYHRHTRKNNKYEKFKSLSYIIMSVLDIAENTIFNHVCAQEKEKEYKSEQLELI